MSIESKYNSATITNKALNVYLYGFDRSYGMNLLCEPLIKFSLGQSHTMHVITHNCLKNLGVIAVINRISMLTLGLIFNFVIILAKLYLPYTI